eukprot:COSAG02_NODE_28166_length_594_cov_127.337374_1_plen_42_part_10
MCAVWCGQSAFCRYDGVRVVPIADGLVLVQRRRLTMHPMRGW